MFEIFASLTVLRANTDVIVIWNLPWLSADSCSEVEINPPPRNPENISLRISQDP